MEQNKKKKSVQRTPRYNVKQREEKKVEVTKKTEKAKDNSMRYLYLFVVVVAFAFAFLLLINMQDGVYMNDLGDGGFDVTPEVGKVIVARDMNAIYPKYYVVYTDSEEYSIYVYNYYETVSQYELEFNRLIDRIVDYNEKDKMIRYLYDRGYGTYPEVLNNLSMLVDSSNLKIY